MHPARKPRQRSLWPALLVLLAAGLAAWLLNVSRPGTRVEGCPQGCAAAVPGDERSLRILSLNVLHGFPRFEELATRLDAVAAEIRRQGVDVACLQEVPWTPRLGSGAAYLARATGLNYLYVRANGNRRAILFEEGEAILSRYPLQDPQVVELEPRAGPFEHRVVLRATAAIPWGDLDVFVTHLTHGEQDINRRQASALLAMVPAAGESPALVAGDLNAAEGSAQMRALAGAWIDLYRAANPGQAGATCCVDDVRQGPGKAMERRIDYLFWVPRGGPVPEVQAWVVLDRPFPREGGWLWPSDHAGVLVELTGLR